MSQITVQQLAEQVDTPVEKLLAQLNEAGVKVSAAGDEVSETDRAKLLSHLSGEPTQAAPRRITLKRTKTGEIKLGGNRGSSSRTVTVQVRKRRTYVKSEGSDAEQQAQEDEAAEDARLQAEREAEEARRQADEEMRRLKAEEEARRQVESEEKARLDAAAAGQLVGNNISPELEAMRRRAAENAKRAAQGKPLPVASSRSNAETPPAAGAPAADSGRASRGGRTRGKSRSGGDGRRMPQEGILRGKGRRKKGRKDVHVETEHAFEKPVTPVKREVEIPEFITVGELASRMAVKSSEVIKVLMQNGAMATINQNIDHDAAHLVVEEMGHTPKTAKPQDAESELMASLTDAIDEAPLLPRPPVVTIMGHVDHGKTSLLDYIRKTRVATGEAGGITQHIGAYHVETSRGVVTFLDTPGHAAFTKMRARGAKATDVVVLVCAADDSVMPQTREAVQHARAAGAPIVVAVTKSDKEDANPERVRSDLSSEGVTPEEWGGDTQFVNVSSVTGDGVDALLEAISLQAELLELKAPVDARAQGVVVESRLDKGRGPVATVLVRSGTLKTGDSVLCGQYFGRVRALFDEVGGSPKSVGPSLPVEILGLSGVPNAGDELITLPDERRAREVAEQREASRRENRLAKQQAARLDRVMANMGKGEEKVLNLMVKADVQGSAEALCEALQKIPSEEVFINIISSGVGGITESDVELALASSAIILAFNVRADATARKLIAQSGVDVRYYSIIYDLINDVRDAVGGLLGTEVREKFVGLASVKDVFNSSKLGQIAGCLVEDGYVAKSLPIRVLRDNVVIFEGMLESLRRFKDNVERVEAGTECGIGVKDYKDVHAGDQIEVFERSEVQRVVQESA